MTRNASSVDYRIRDNKGDYHSIEIEPLCEELRESAYPIIRDDLGPEAGFRSCMGIPLRTNGGFLGAITAIAEILAVAIHNNRHFRRAISELETDEFTGFLTRTSFERGAEKLWNSYCARHPG